MMLYLCGFGSFVSSLSWHLWLGAGDKDGLATAISFLGATAGVRHDTICYSRRVDVSADVAPVETR